MLEVELVKETVYVDEVVVELVATTESDENTTKTRDNSAVHRIQVLYLADIELFR